MKFDYFSPELTTGSIYFEIWLLVFLIAILIYWFKNYRFFLWRFFALVFWVFCFESLTWALWINSNLWNYAYVHNDISWIMPFAWASIIIFFKFIFDKFCAKWNILREFIFVILNSSIFWLLFLIYLKTIWVFSYSLEMQEIIKSWITIFWRPLEAIIYFPTFIFVVFSFYKYWELAMFDKKLFQNYKINFWKDIIIAILSITLIWYLMHPLLITDNILNYFYLIFSFIIVLVITNIVVNLWKDFPLFIRFLAGSTIFTIFWTIVFNFFVSNKLIILSKSILNTYTSKTVKIPYMEITDVEWAWIFVFSYLVIAIVKYFKVINENENIVLDEKNMTFKGWKSLINNEK